MPSWEIKLGEWIPAFMLAAMAYDFGDIRLEEVGQPRVGDGDILVRMRACGICSSDILPWYIRRKVPIVLGHEPVGVVAEVGAHVKGFKPGDRVFVHHHAPCFECSKCRRGEYVQCPTWRSSRLVPGGMAEYFLAGPVNQRDSLLLPATISDADGVLIEPLACTVKSLRRAGLKPGDTVVVIGMGVMGVMHLKLARHLGAGFVIGADLFPERVEMGLKMGADVAFKVSGDDLVEKVREATAGAMADVVIVGPGTVGALTTGISVAGKGGTVVMFTPTAPEEVLEVRPEKLYFDEIRLIPSYSCGPDDTREAMKLILGGVVTAADLVTHRFALKEAVRAYEVAQKPESLKVIVTTD